MTTIPYGRQDITQDDIDAVINVLRSDFLTQGPLVPAFESVVANYCNAKHAVAVSNATCALHIACLALGVGNGDIVWTTPITFVASANCALYCGAKVDFVDIDPNTFNISLKCLKDKLDYAERSGYLPKVVIPVHLCGQACDMAGIYALSKRYGFKIIEDASHAIGGKYKQQPIGNCCFSDITVFSFHPVKIVTTAEGGMALTNNSELAGKMELFRSHGITRDSSKMTHKADGPWYYQQIELGYNFRMTDLQAALGISQMKRLDAYVAKRNQLALNYDNLLCNLPVTRQWQHCESYSSFHLYVIRLQDNGYANTHIEVFEWMRSQGIGVNLHYIPMYRHPYYEVMGFRHSDFPEAERYYAEAITLPMYTELSHEQQQSIILSLNDIIGLQKLS